MQCKLLRAIQERAVRPVGAVTEEPVNVRIAQRDPQGPGAEVQAGHFRQDLYYRLNVIQIRVPPLRERLEDLPAISERVLERIARDAGVSPPPRLTRDALVQLARYAFPGNVRELENLLHRAVALSGGEEIDVDDLGLPESVFTDSAAQELDQIASAAESATERRARARRRDGAGRGALADDLAAYLDEVERDILVRALEHHRFNRTAAGASLGLSLRQMRYRMARLGVKSAATPAAPTASERGRRATPTGAPAGRRGARAVRVAELGRGPPARGRPGRPAFDQPAAGRLRRRRDRAPVHQPARLERASVLRDDPRARGVGALPGPARRRAAAVRVVRRARLARRRLALARPRRCNDFSVGIELEGLEGEAFEAAQYASLAALLRALVAALSDRRGRRARACRAGPQARSRRAASTGRGCAVSRSALKLRFGGLTRGLLAGGPGSARAGRGSATIGS